MEILFVEDGSVDTNELEKLGINYIVFRQGSTFPEVIKVDEDRSRRQQLINDINTISFELSKYKRALELACERLSREDVFEEQTKQDYYLKQVKKELEEQDVKNS